ncbi:hypothetical protein C8Q74DRAFT_1446120 [Fomes fomentarius]|nr:hypothetical protein C8Q74DRAFT_1446120 [Fomes fomentarius]
MELSKPISINDYMVLCDVSGGEAACDPVDPRVVGPKEIVFKMSGSKQKGISMRELLLNPTTAYLIEGARDEAIRVFLDNGVADIRVVIWAPERPGGKWTQQVRRIPVVSSAGEPLTNRATLGLLVASEYSMLCARLERRVHRVTEGAALSLDHLLLVAARQIAWNVYQVEVAPDASSVRHIRF